MTINNKSERNYRGKCLGWPVTSYGAACIMGYGPGCLQVFVHSLGRESPK